MEEIQRIWHGRLGMEGGGNNREMEEVQLIDLTPMGPCDTLLVAEAVISRDVVPRLLNMSEPDTRSKLRKVEYGLEIFESTNLELSISMGKGSVIGSSIGGERM